LRVRFEKVAVKRELSPSPERSACSVRDGESATAVEGVAEPVQSALAPRLQPPKPLQPRADGVLGMLQARSRKGRAAENRMAEEAQEEADVAQAIREVAEQAQQEEDERQRELAAAQTASYDGLRREKREREVRDRKRVQDGDTGPLEELDEELTMAIMCCEGTCDWLSAVEHRLLLHHYLRLRAQAERWYAEPAKAYIVERREALREFMDGPRAALEFDTFLQGEADLLQEALYEMPANGCYVPGWVPELFRGSDSPGEEGAGPVEVDD